MTSIGVTGKTLFWSIAPLNANCRVQQPKVPIIVAGMEIASPVQDENEASQTIKEIVDVEDQASGGNDVETPYLPLYSSMGREHLQPTSSAEVLNPSQKKKAKRRGATTAEGQVTGGNNVETAYLPIVSSAGGNPQPEPPAENQNSSRKKSLGDEPTSLQLESHIIILSHIFQHIQTVNGAL